jgi:hypothetical protein
MSYRYIVQRALTGQLLDTDLPLRPKTRAWELSGVDALSGSLAPAIGGSIAEDDRSLLEEWGSYVYLEADGIIRLGGIVVSSKLVGSEWEIECAGFTTYPHGIPFDGDEYLREKVDPADVVRDIWGHVQAHRDADLGVQVTGSTTVRIGTESTRQVRFYEAMVKERDAIVKVAQKAYDDVRKIKEQRYKEKQAALKVKQAAQKTLTAAKKAGTGVAAAQAAYNAAKTAYDAAVTVSKAATAALVGPKNVLDQRKEDRDAAKEKVSDWKERENEDGGAYLLQWWDSPDLGREIAELAETTPFDFTEHHTWNDDHTAIAHELRIHYPRAGRRRTDLSFEQGVNIVAFDSPEREGDGFANEIIGIGAGEGAGSVRRTTALRDGRLRRPRVVTAKDIKNRTRMDAVIRTELERSRQLLTIPSITVKDHPHAEIGSWELGDDIRVEVDLPWWGQQSIWHRVIAWELLTDTTAKLTLARSDSFTYGG